MHLFELVNTLSDKRYKSYLEIGVDWGTTFNQVDIVDKTGVDPALKVPSSTLTGTFYDQTSDDYFVTHNDTFDCILIDGLHTYEQSRRDFENAWKRLNSGGVVIIDDCDPADDLAALPDVDACMRGRAERGTPEDMTWNGDVYKTVIWLNDCTDYAYAYVRDTRGYVVVWQDTRRANRWFKDEAAIAACDYNTFKTLTLPTLTLGEIIDKVRPRFSLKALFGGR